MASLTQWTWIWVNSGSWRWTGRPGVLQSMGSQRVGHNWATELEVEQHVGASSSIISLPNTDIVCIWSVLEVAALAAIVEKKVQKVEGKHESRASHPVSVPAISPEQGPLRNADTWAPIQTYQRWACSRRKLTRATQAMLWQAFQVTLMPAHLRGASGHSYGVLKFTSTT